MDVHLIAVGRTISKAVDMIVEEYAARLPHYIPFYFTYIPDLKNKKNLSEQRQKEMEGEMVLRKLTPSDFVVLFDERGKEYTSVQFSEFMQKQMSAGRKRLVFVIGGPYGFSEAMYDRADSKMSLSKMTFNHEMVRAFAVEQIYRAMTILRGEPYHHD